MRKRLLLLCAVLVCVTSMLVIPAFAAEYGGEIGNEPVEGKRFESSDIYTFPSIAEDIATMEAELWFDPHYSESNSCGTVIGNRSADTDGSTQISWEISEGGRLSYHNSTAGTVTFNVNLCDFIEDDQFIKIAVVLKNDTDGQRLLLYVNGIMREVKTENDGGEAFRAECLTPGADPSDASVSGRPLRLGGDWREDNTFTGHLKNITLYSDVRTSDEIKSAAYASAYSVDSTDTALVAAYDTTGYVGKDLSTNGYDITFETTAGISPGQCKGEDLLHIRKPIEAVPRTYEATIYMPDSVTGSGGYVLCNYNASTSRLGVLITGGSPRLLYTMTDGKYSTDASTFGSVDVRLNGWVHLALVHDGSTLYCYINGALVGSLSQEKDIHTKVMTGQPYVVGGDWRSNNTQYFKGRIKDIALYSKVKTAEEIKNSYLNGTNLEDEDIMFYLGCDGSDRDFIEDRTGNGYDAVRGPKQTLQTWVDSTANMDDYAYTFAVVGDTQKLCYQDYLNASDDDTTNDTAYMASIYDWIVENKESQKIEFVIGVGDITEKSIDGEWEIARENITKLSDAGIPYSLVWGKGHDTVSKLNKYFGTESNFVNADIGYYYPDTKSLATYYMRFTMGGTKYLLFGFDWGPSDAMLEWAGEIIEANPDHKVIITTHSYLAKDGTHATSDISLVPRELTDATGKNNGDQIWTKLASQYENVEYVFCGHDPTENLVWRQDVGIHGNTVTQFLVDPQNFDAYSTYKYQTGMIALFHVSADGKTVAVEWYSTEQGKYYQERNQFTFTIPDKIVQQDVETEYGIIPGTYSNVVTYPFALFKTDKTFVGAYGDLGAATEGMLNYDNSADYVLLMRRTAEQTKHTVLSGFTGSLTVELSGNRLYKAGNSYLLNIKCTDNSSVAGDVEHNGTYVFRNGEIYRGGGKSLCTVNYDSNLKKDVSISLAFEDVLFTSPYGTTLIFENTESNYSAVPSDLRIRVAADFTDCTFDYVNSADGITMLKLSSDTGYDKIIVDATLAGVIIKANEAVTLNDFALMNDDTNGRADSVVIKENENGEYLTMILPVGASAPGADNLWIDDNGRRVTFVQSASSVSDVSYSTVPVLLKDFGAKISITLWTNYVFNVYVPVNNVEGIEIDGSPIDLTMCRTAVLGGVEYYVVQKQISVNEMLENKAISVLLSDGDESVTVTKSFCLFDYASTIISGDYSIEEKLLMMDVLSYARAAYAYAGVESEYVERINWLIGYEYDSDSMPDLSREILTPSDNAAVESCLLNIGETIKFRFYLQDGYSKDDLVFKVGDTVTAAKQGTDENGRSYLEIEVYAYRLCDNISFTVEIDGASVTHSYNIYSYYEYICENYFSDKALISFVERMIRYSESASAYRLSVLE